MIASNRVRAVFPAGAKARASTAQTSRTPNRAAPPKIARARQFARRTRDKCLRGCGRRTGGLRVTLRVVARLVKNAAPQAPLYRGAGQGSSQQYRGRISVYISPALPALPMPTKRFR